MNTILYYIILFTHYVLLPFLVSWLPYKYKFNPVYSCLGWFIIWLSSGIIFNGCILTHAENFYAGKTGRIGFTQTVITYLLHKS